MFKSIIVPVDIADLGTARLAMRSAARLADAQASVTLIHVVAVMPVAMLDTVSVTMEDEVAQNANPVLADLGREMVVPGGSVFTVVRIGAVAHEVLSLAEEQKADLIVVGSHQPTVASFLLGSNSSAIVRQAPCSVMVVREDQARVIADAPEALAAPSEEKPALLETPGAAAPVV